jgi:hypothetical protein
MLLPFLADLLRDPNLQNEFHKSPDKVMREAGLTPQEIDLVQKSDVSKIAAAVASEVESALSSQKDFWILVFRLTAIDDHEAHVGAPLQTTVHGSGFLQSTTCWLEQKGERIQGHVSNIEGGIHSRMNVRFDIPVDASRGHYDVVAEQTPQGARDRLERAVRID